MARWLAALALAFAVFTAAHAQVARMLPANGKVGELVGRQHAFPLVQIDNKVLRLAPGGLIYDENNRTILHNALPDRAQVLYVPGPGDDVTRIYILRPQELELIKRNPVR